MLVFFRCREVNISGLFGGDFRKRVRGGEGEIGREVVNVECVWCYIVVVVFWVRVFRGFWEIVWILFLLKWEGVGVFIFYFSDFEF